VLIKAVQSETQQAVVAMEEGTKEVEAGYKVTVEAGDSLHQIGEISQSPRRWRGTSRRATQEQVRGVEGGAVAVQSIAGGRGPDREGGAPRRARPWTSWCGWPRSCMDSLSRFKLAT